VTSFLLALADVVAWFGALLIVLAGAMKLRSPRVAAGFLARIGFPASLTAVRVIALVELAAGVAVLVSGRDEALMVAAALYASFGAALLIYLRRTGERYVSCGCFGSSLELPVLEHLAGVATVVVALLVTAIVPSASLAHVLAATAPGLSILLVFLEALALVGVLGFIGAPANRSASSAAGDFRLLPPAGGN